MNTTETMAMLTDRDAATGEYRIPQIIYADAFFSETVAFADLVLPDTTYLERWDCISLLDRPIGAAGRHPRCDPPAGDRARPRRPPVPGRADRPGRTGSACRPSPPPDGGPRFPGGYADYMVHHERKPGVGPLAGWRGADGTRSARASPIRRQLDAYIANGCFFSHELRAGAVLDEARQPRLSRARPRHRPDRRRRRRSSSSSTARSCRSSGWPRRATAPAQPPDSHRARIERYFDPLPIWYPPFEQAAVDEASSRCTRSPSGRWPCTTAGIRRTPGCGRSTPPTASMSIARRPQRPGPRRRRLGLGDQPPGPDQGADPAVPTACSRTRCGPGTRSASAGRLEPRRRTRRKSNEGFLLNHLIDELLPPADDGRRWANCRSGHRAGGLVRPDGADREGRRGGPHADRCRPAAPPGMPDRPTAALRCRLPATGRRHDRACRRRPRRAASAW